MVSLNLAHPVVDWSRYNLTHFCCMRPRFALWYGVFMPPHSTNQASEVRCDVMTWLDYYNLLPGAFPHCGQPLQHVQNTETCLTVSRCTAILPKALYHNAFIVFFLLSSRSWWFPNQDVKCHEITNSRVSDFGKLYWLYPFGDFCGQDPH